MKADFARLENKALVRCGIYSLLSNIFSNEPTREFAQMLKKGRLFQKVAEFANLEADFKELEEYTQRNDAEQIYKKLLSDYRELFKPEGKSRVSVYEADYAQGSKSKEIDYSDICVEVARTYSQTGFDVQAGYKGRPDHIGMELEYMALLCQIEMGYWASRDKQQAEEYLRWESQFLHEHLNKWIHLFCDKVILAGPSEFFAIAARLSDAFVKADSQNIDSLITGDYQ